MIERDCNMNKILKERFKRELEGFTINDNYIENSSIDKEPIEYLIITLDNHYYVISYRVSYVVSEVDSPTREALQLSPTKILSRRELVDYLRQLKIRVN
jgi:hypothetical protein